MKLLIITQAVDIDDPILGFFHEWIVHFASKNEFVYVIAQRVGRHMLPANVRVYTAAKSKEDSKFVRLFRMISFIHGVMPNSDKVFVHMAPLYAIIAFPFTRLYKKPMALWYVHRTVDLKLRIAEKMVQIIFSASKESFRLSSKKLQIVGHGIETNLFKPGRAPEGPPLFLAVGRISRSKKLDFLIEALSYASYDLPANWRLLVLGNPITAEDNLFRLDLDKKIKDLGLRNHIEFKGGVPNKDMPTFYQNVHLFLHASTTGSIDKTVLEAMSTNLPVVSSSEAFYDLLPIEYVVKSDSPESFGEAIKRLWQRGRDGRLRRIIEEHFNLTNLIQTITDKLEKI